MSARTNRSFHKTDDDSPSVVVTRAVSAASGTPVQDLPPLNDVIDPDALDSLFSDRQTRGRVEFRYAGVAVTVFADRTIELSRGD